VATWDFVWIRADGPSLGREPLARFTNLPFSSSPGPARTPRPSTSALDRKSFLFVGQNAQIQSVFDGRLDFGSWPNYVGLFPGLRSLRWFILGSPFPCA